jgi:hypothetical protein
MPYGIQLSAIVSLRTGTPWNITAGQDLNGDGVNVDRPAGLVKNAGGRVSDTNLALINAFRVARGREPITMDQLAQRSGDRLVDVRLMKQVLFGSRRSRVDLFFEAYNLLNAVNYENPSGNLISTSFAVRTVARDARQLQWGARFSF